MSTVRKICKILMADIWFHIFASTSLLLIVTSFFIPPTGVIDSSVFAGVGELFAFGALWELHVAIRKGMDAKIQHNNTTIEINNDNSNELAQPN